MAKAKINTLQFYLERLINQYVAGKNLYSMVENLSASVQ